MKHVFTAAGVFFVLTTAAFAAADTSINNGPVFGQSIVFPKNGMIAPSGAQAGKVASATGTVATGTAAGAAGCGAVTTAHHVLGSRDAGVKAVQTFLNTYTGAGLPVTGFYGARTQAAVKRFQAAHGLPTTGNQYSRTTALMNDVACTGDSSYVSMYMKKGYRGAQVARLQRFLTDRGFAVPATGFFGPKTEQAVMAFQKQEGIPATGKVWNRTLAAVNGQAFESRLARVTGTVAAAPAAPVVNVVTQKVDDAVKAAADATPTVTVTTGDDTQTAAVGNSGFMNSQALPWILLVIAAGLAYYFGPWRQVAEETTTPTTQA